MPQSDLDELTGRTTDGVSRAARYLAIADRGLSACSPAELDEIYLLWEAMGEDERDDVRRVNATHNAVNATRNAENATRNAALPRSVETQASISTWAEATFGPSGSNARAVARANREMSELLEHVTADDRHPEAAEEVADIVIVLYRIATRLGVDLHELIDRKMATNRARTWRLDGTGHGYHVKEGNEVPMPPATHVLWGGMTLCEDLRLRGFPRDWPKGQRWISLGDVSKGLDLPSNHCAACWAKVPGLVLRQIGAQ